MPATYRPGAPRKDADVSSCPTTARIASPTRRLTELVDCAPSSGASAHVREWIGGRLSPPFFIHDRAEPYRPDLVLWMELPDAFVVGQAVAMPEDTQGAVARTLRNALTQPAGGSPRQPRPCPRRWPRYRRRGARRRSRERYPSRSPRRRSSTISCSTVATMPASQDDEPSYFVAGRISAAEVEKLFARRCCGWTSRRSASGRPNPHPFRCLRRSPHAGTPAARW